MPRLSLTALFLLFSALACGGPASVSERSVLPGFEAGQLAHKRLLLAPYPPSAVNEERAIPLSAAEVRALAATFPDSDAELSALKAFYFSGESSARQAAQRANQELTVVHIDAPRWHDYFENSEDFLNVTVDGKVHYQIPQRALLQRLDRDADFAIVIGGLAYSAEIMTMKSDTMYTQRRTASCDANFLIWDYQANRALAEGTVNSSTDFAKEITGKEYQELGGEVIAEIMAKRPFR